VEEQDLLLLLHCLAVERRREIRFDLVVFFSLLD
jgi:hypothetical protein